MKYLIFIAALLFTQEIVHSQWIQQYSGSSAIFQDVFFMNHNTGYVIAPDTNANSKFYKTTNSGLNWNYIGVIPGIAALSIHFTTEFIGYCVGYGGKIFKTTNGGINWFQQYNPGPNGYLSEIEFIGQDTGYIVGDGGVFLKTTNGGANWVKYQHYLLYRFNCLDFIDANTGYIAGEYDNGGIMIKTTNGGANWISRYSLNSYFTGISFCDAFTGYAVGLFGTVYKTTNGGQNFPDWQLCAPVNAVYDVKTFNKDTAILAGNSGIIWRTVNGGNNWEIQNSQPGSSLNALFFFNKDTGFAVGDPGLILKTTNGGVPIGITNISNEIPDNYKLFQNYPNPFNPMTKIRFSLPNPSEGGVQALKLIVYDALGREVAILVNEQLNAGTYEADWDASKFTSGAYYYKLTAGDFTECKRMVLVK